MPTKRATTGRSVGLGKASKKTPTPTRRLYCGGTAVMELLLWCCTVPRRSRRSWRCRGDPTADFPNPRCHCGSVEHVQSFRCAIAKVRGFDGFPRCYGDQRRNHCRTTAILAVPLRFMPYKHRSCTAPPVCRGY